MSTLEGFHSDDIPALAGGVIRDGEPVDVGSFGHSNVELDVRNEPTRVDEIGSAPSSPMRLLDFRERLRAAGALPQHERRVLRLWANALPQTSGKRRLDGFMPRRLLDALPGIEAQWHGLARLHSEHPAADGSSRLLVALADGQTVECVLLPRADGLCISTQVGCAVGCLFCMTGRSGLTRQLGSAEIVAQVALARTLRPVRKVVFMGMGEPAHNLDNVLEAIDLLGYDGTISHKNLVFSTVGDRRVFERLPLEKVRPALALSLHSTDAARRARLLPRAPRIAPDELVDLGERYARTSGYPIQYQWTLLKGVNDGPDELDGLTRLLRGKYAVLNLIPYNAVDGSGFERPEAGDSEALARELHRRGVLTKLRQSAGQEVDAGCGQLRMREVTSPPTGSIAIRAASAPGGDSTNVQGRSFGCPG